MRQISELKKGEFFKMKPEAKKVWVYDGYNRSNRSWDAHAFDDHCDFKYTRDKNRLVHVDFEF